MLQRQRPATQRLAGCASSAAGLSDGGAAATLTLLPASCAWSTRIARFSDDADPSLAYGPLYAQQVQATFGELAKRHDIPLIPFLLEGIAGNPA